MPSTQYIILTVYIILCVPGSGIDGEAGDSAVGVACQQGEETDATVAEKGCGVSSRMDIEPTVPYDVDTDMDTDGDTDVEEEKGVGLNPGGGAAPDNSETVEEVGGAGLSDTEPVEEEGKVGLDDTEPVKGEERGAGPVDEGRVGEENRLQDSDETVNDASTVSNSDTQEVDEDGRSVATEASASGRTGNMAAAAPIKVAVIAPPPGEVTAPETLQDVHQESPLNPALLKGV